MWWHLLHFVLAALVVARGAGAAEVPWIAVDIGHTLAAPGATSARGMPEFEFNRLLGLRLAEVIREQGDRAEAINADGLMASLSARSRAADSAALLVSVHHDSVQPHFIETWEDGGVLRSFSDRFAGFSLFVSRRNPELAASLRCASAMGAALRRTGFVPSLYHAQRIQGESKPFADRENGVHYYDNLIVLKSARVPAVLFEAGVIVNRDEELLLHERARRDRMAVALAAGISACSLR